MALVKHLNHNLSNFSYFARFVVFYNHSTSRNNLICCKLVPIGIHIECTSWIKNPFLTWFGVSTRNHLKLSFALNIFYNISFSSILYFFSLLLCCSHFIPILQFVAISSNVSLSFAKVTYFFSIFRLRFVYHITTKIPPMKNMLSTWPFDLTAKCFIFSSASWPYQLWECYDSRE